MRRRVDGTACTDVLEESLAHSNVETDSTGDDGSRLKQIGQVGQFNVAFLVVNDGGYLLTKVKGQGSCLATMPTLCTYIVHTYRHK